MIQDDVLLLRFVLLFIISEEVRKSKQEEEQVTLFLEQPADLDKMARGCHSLANEDLESLGRAVWIEDSDLQSI